MARFLSEATEVSWTSTRNSGRTDLKGDVYPKDSKELPHSIVECKDRDMSLATFLNAPKWLADAVVKVQSDCRSTFGPHVKDYALFVNVSGMVFCHLGADFKWGLSDYFSNIKVTDVFGRTWRKVVV